ncbi:MAG: TolC family protein [Candidatus Aminicenantes bacterium]|nr:TolC family protein [Candidatus Aminicenantes bacterium]
MKNAVKVLIIISFVLYTGSLGFSQEKLKLTLEKSVELALKQNPQHLATAQRVDAARSGVREAVSAFFPSLNGQGQRTLNEKVMELEFPSMIPGEPPQRVEIDFTRDYQFSLALSMPLYTGGLLVAGYKQADYNLKSSQQQLRQSRQSTVFNTKQAFFGILLAEHFVEVAQESVKDAEDFYENVKIQYEVGMASQFDLLRSEVRLANLQPQLIKAKNNLEIAKLNLKTILGLDLSTEIETEGKLEYIPSEIDLEECITKALSNRPELKQLSFQKMIAGEGLKMARASGLPSVAVSGQYNFWADQFNFKDDTWQNYYSLNLVLSIPVFNGLSSSAKAAKSKAAIRELELTQEGLIEMLKFEVMQAVLKIKEAEQSLLSQGKNVEQAQESLRIAELNYNEGLVTILDVQQAQTALAQAKTNYSQALYDYAVARAELDKATGVDKNE